jgi:type I restriction enzyme M protein
MFFKKIILKSYNYCFAKPLCDVFDNELNRIAQRVKTRAKAFKLVENNHQLVRFYRSH